ncbi:amylo-alpha-1,6-glucosidase [Clostridium gasigenes]|uniref:amylo-alpha-1,6-glucosidase n=1 Tax=Clostridium gasigenes TaxID=94869 RepID=UPI001C0D14C3|nr:amylo-alpha-1,6-glucosidase [Clostridium gasigenes]MBU3133023.1 amylo-alpha-1,6-glucosidase [Clostridium gasigenes]
MRFSKNSFSSYDRGIEKEWILTNGRSGFSGSTIIGANSRKYHGLLIAAIKSPDERYMVLPKVEETLILNNKLYPLTSTKYIGETIEGFKNLQSFTHEGIPTYRYLACGVDIQKRVFLQYGKNTAIIEYKIKGNGQEGILKLTPFVSFRNPGECSSLDNLTFEKTITEKGFKLIPKTKKDIKINLFATSGETKDEEEIFTDYVFYDVDITSGDKCIEQYYIPGSIEIEFNEDTEKTVYFIATIEKEIPTNIEEIVEQEEIRIEKLKNTFNDDRPIAKYLPLGADNFIVDRDSINSKTILAGYPWFLDWGRDTMIAITGLTMSTNRLEDAKDILKSFSLYEKNGLIPNMFPDFGQEPLYNTVDASLWYVKGIYDYLLYSDSEESVTFIKDEIYPTIKKIIDSYKKGTDFSIGMKDDYLIWAGDGLDQVTWMDVRVNDIVVTPRHGKPVEINALWYNALKITSLLANKFGDSEGNEYEELAIKVKNSFENKFWNEKDKCLYDVVSDNESDASIRPNQIWAVSLPFSILDREKEKAVVNTVYKELYTPYGLRSLSRNHEDYKPMYIGKLFERDMAYHQGTVWGFPLGGFLTAYCKVNDYSKESVEFVDNCLKDMESHIQDQCLCGIAEIFDGEAPHHGRGCYTQAWSVGEIIRVYYEDVLGNIDKLNKVHTKLFVD